MRAIVLGLALWMSLMWACCWPDCLDGMPTSELHGAMKVSAIVAGLWALFYGMRKETNDEHSRPD